MNSAELLVICINKKNLRDNAADLLKASKELQEVLDEYATNRGKMIRSDWAMTILAARDNLSNAINKCEGKY